MRCHLCVGQTLTRTIFLSGKFDKNIKYVSQFSPYISSPFFVCFLLSLRMISKSESDQIPCYVGTCACVQVLTSLLWYLEVDWNFHLLIFIVTIAHEIIHLFFFSRVVINLSLLESLVSFNYPLCRSLHVFSYHPCTYKSPMVYCQRKKKPVREFCSDILFSYCTEVEFVQIWITVKLWTFHDKLLKCVGYWPH